MKEHLTIQGYVITRRHGNYIVAKEVLEDLKVSLKGMTVSQKGRPVGRIEEVEVDDKGLRVKIKMFKK